MKILYLLAGLFILSYGSAQDGESSQLRLLFAGDLMGHDSQIAAAKTAEGYNYDTCFAFLKPYIEGADISVVNLEVTLAGPPYKGYPQFSSPDELAHAAGNAGFDIFVNSNNHALDRRRQGLERTIDVLEDNELIRTGTFKNQAQRDIEYPLIVEMNNIRLAILNYSYGTNGLKTEGPNIVNYIDKAIISADIQKAKTAEPDFIIVTIHWGKEYQREESEGQQKLAKFLIKEGADAIIGSHPHVVQPVKELQEGGKNVVVVYSLGNFISNQRKRYTDGGILFEMTLEKNEGVTELRDYSYLPFWVYKANNGKGGKHFVLLPSGLEESWYRDELKMPEADLIQMQTFDTDTRLHLQGIEITKKGAD